MIKIPESEIRKRFQKLRNYEKNLYPQLKERSNRLRVENKTLKQENAQLKKENKQIEKLQLQLEELRAMKFGKKRKNPSESPKALPKMKEKEERKRSKESYRRPDPKPEQITDHLRMGIERCPECDSELTNKKEHIHYREDLYEVEKLLESAKKIVETIVESGKCPSCGKKKFAMEIPGQKVTIGENIRTMLVYMMIVQGQSYSEAKKSLKHQYGVELSEGEIVNILEGESILVTPYYNCIVESLQDEDGAHYDETSWKTRNQGKDISEGNYCWIKIGARSQNRLIWFGRSRGKGVAEELRGEKSGSIGVSDDYGSYRNLFDYHQLCWAHPNRKLRDMAESENLSGKTKKVCKKAYRDFAKVYKKAKKTREKLQSGTWDEEERIKQRTKLEKLFEILFETTPYDPEKLKAIRASLKKRKDRYFTFFLFPYLPLDNNKAERALRKIVIKRKKSFGCRSQKGANVLSILCSVVFSLIESNPNQSFFTLYRRAIQL
jgi:transposase